MKGVQFHLEFANTYKRRKGEHSGTVVAIFTDPNSKWWDTRVNEMMVSAIGAVYDYPNSPVAGTTASMGYIRTRTKRISEAKAREIHPLLIRYLEQ